MRVSLFLLLFVFISACTQQATTTTSIESTGEKLTLTTDDDVKIAATYWDRGTNKNLILLHMLGGDRTDWTNFAENAPYTTIAIDLRGHGDNRGNWQLFSETDFNDMIFDAKAAAGFIKSDDIIKEDPAKIVIIGASIGANVAINYANKYSADGVVMLSPGLNYRGVKTQDSMTLYDGAVLVVASQDDVQSRDTSQILYNIASGKKQIKMYEDAGHGTAMFVKDDLDDIILQFISEI